MEVFVSHNFILGVILLGARSSKYRLKSEMQMKHHLYWPPLINEEIPRTDRFCSLSILHKAIAAAAEDGKLLVRSKAGLIAEDRSDAIIHPDSIMVLYREGSSRMFKAINK